jgi:uncharacterized membrane protein (DUF4010 family)
MNAELISLIQSFIVALFLGGLIGLEREAFIQKENKKRFAGIRTFSLIGFLGALSVFLGNYSPVLTYILFVGFIIIVAIAYLVTAITKKDISALPNIASIIVFIIGYLSGQEKFWLAIFITLITFLIIHFEDILHKFAKTIKEEELYSTIKFIIITLLILPILPNQEFGPFQVLNPYVIWLMVVFISGISFLSYIAIKTIGVKKGIGLTGFLAGLVSSTAVTLSFAAQSKKYLKIINPYVFGVVIASSAMFFRILAETYVLNPKLFEVLLIPLGAMGVIGTISAIVYWKKKEIVGRKKVSEQVIKLKSPFQLNPAIKFGLLFALVLLVSKISMIYLGSKGIFATSIISGLVDTDAITVSLSKLSSNGLPLETAAIGITLATIVNTISKGVLFYFLGNRVAGKSVAKILLLMLIAGGAAIAGVILL